MLKKIFIIFPVLALFSIFPALAKGEDSTSGSIDAMQKQVMELQEKITALKQIHNKKEPSIQQVEGQRRHAQMAQAQELILRPAQPLSPPPATRGRTLAFYGGATTWGHYRTNNETAVKTADDGLDAGYSLDLFLEAGLDRNHKFIVYGETGDGNGIDHSLGTTGLYSTPNYDAYNTSGHVTISEAYYEGVFFDDMLTLSLGKMDIHSLYDENEIAGDETTQFMSNIFVRSTGVSFHELKDYYAPGIRALWTPLPIIEVTLVLANENFDDADNNGLAAFQVNFKPSNVLFGGNYRFFVVFDDRPYTQVGTGNSDNNIGWGFSFDQRFNEWVGGFFRYSMLEKDLQENVVDSSWAFGIEVNGLLWNRREDALGLAYGTARVNKRVTSPLPPHTTSEKHFEAYYRYQVNDYIAMSPNLQVVTDQPRTNPSTVTIFGIRGQFDFRL